MRIVFEEFGTQGGRIIGHVYMVLDESRVTPPHFGPADAVHRLGEMSFREAEQYARSRGVRLFRYS